MGRISPVGAAGAVWPLGTVFKTIVAPKRGSYLAVQRKFYNSKEFLTFFMADSIGRPEYTCRPRLAAEVSSSARSTDTRLASSTKGYPLRREQAPPTVKMLYSIGELP